MSLQQWLSAKLATRRARAQNKRDELDYERFQAIIRAHKNFVAEISKNLKSLSTPYPPEAIEWISSALKDVLGEAGLPSNQKEIAAVIEAEKEEGS